MSKTIDQKVVEMQFDNKDFEKNVATSMGTIDKLKQKLDFSNEGKSFQDLEKQAGKTNFSGFKDNIESVSVKFNAMQVAAVTALTNITNKAVDAGIQLVKSLSIDQITEGFGKFSDKTTNVATLVAQGYDIDLVNEQMDRLNWFTDETSYNYVEMAKNIAKFTATGQGLEDSVTAMEGIATWAALSGQNAATASNAMYQLSQAMGAGAMRREDYKSIQNASMDTQEFRQHAIDAAIALGQLRDNADGTYTAIGELAKKEVTFTKEQFTEGLTEGMWFTKDVMMKVFNEYSAAVNDIYAKAEETGMTASEVMSEFGDEFDEFGLKAFKAAQEARTFEDAIDSIKDAVSTGFMNTFEIIFGDYEQAKTFWTDIANNAYDVFAEPVNEFNEKLGSALGTAMYDASALKEYSEVYTNAKTDILWEVSEAFSDLDHYTARLLGQNLMVDDHVEIGDQIKEWIADETGMSEAAIDGLQDLIKEYGMDSQEVKDEILILSEGEQALAQQIYDSVETGHEMIQKARTGSNVEAILELGKKMGKDSEEFQEYLTKYVTEDEELQNVIKEFISTQGSGYISEAQVFWVLSEKTGMAKESIEQLYALVNEKGLNDEEVQDFINVLAEGDETAKKFINDYVEGTTKIVQTTTGRQNLVEAFWTLWNGIADIAERVKKAFRNVFPESQWSSMYALTVKIKEAIEKLMPKEETLQKIEDFFTGVFTVFKGIGEVLKTIFKPFGDMIKSLFKKPEGEGTLLDSLANWGKSVSEGFDDFKNGSLVKTISDVSTWIADKLGWLLQTIGGLLGKIKEHISNFFNKEIEVSGEDGTTKTITRLEWFHEKLSALGGWIAEKFTVIRDAVMGFFNDKVITSTDDSGIETKISRLEWIKDKLEKIGAWFMETWDKIKQLFGNIKNTIKTSDAPDTVNTFWEKLKKVFEAIKEGISNMFKKKDAGGGSDSGGTLDTKQVTSFFDKIKTFFEELWAKIEPIWKRIEPLFKSIAKIISNIWDGILWLFDFISKLNFSQLFAGGLGIGSTVLAIDSYKSIKQFLDFLNNFNKTLTEAVNAFKNIGVGVKGTLDAASYKLKVSAITNLLKAIGLMLLEMAAALAIVASIPEDKMASSAIALGVMVGVVGIIFVLLLKFGKGKDSIFESAEGGKISDLDSSSSNLKSMALVMVAMGAALMEIAKALKTVGEIGAGWDLAAAVGAISLIMLVMAGVVKVMNNNSTGFSSGLGTAVELIALCILLKRVVKAVKDLADMDPWKMVQGIAGLAAVMGIIGGIAFIPMDESRAKAFSSAMLVIAIAMWVFGKYMKDVATLNWEDIAKAVAVFMVVIGSLAGIMFIPFEPSKAVAFAGAMDMIAVAMLMMLPVIKAFAEMNSDEYAQALIAVAAITSIMAGLGAIMALVGSIGGGVGGAGALLVGGGLALAAFAVLELAAALAILAEIAPKLEERAPMIANAIVEVTSTLITALPQLASDLAVAVTEMAPNIGQMIITLIKTVCTVLVESALEIAQSLINFILQILSVIKENIGPIIDQVIGIFLEVINSTMSNAAEIVLALVNLFKAIFGALGEAFGDDFDLEKILEGVAIIAALLVAMTAITIMAAEALATVALLNAIADQLNIFIVKVMPFIVACQAIDPNSMEGALLLAEVILALTAASILEGLTSWFTGGVNYAKFAEDLLILAPAMKKFGEEMADVDGENFEKAAHAALYLTEMANNMPHEGGLLQGLVGTAKSMSDFAKELGDLAPKLVEFASKAKELTDDDIKAIERAVGAVNKLSKMANSLPRTGGILQDIIGEVKTLGEFGIELTQLAPKLIEFASEVKKLTGDDAKAIERSANAIVPMIKIANSMPREGGFVQDIIGEAKTLTQFAFEIVDLGRGLLGYAAEVKQLTKADIKHINNSVEAVAGLVAVNNALAPNGNVVISWLLGEDMKFAEFAKNAAFIGAALIGYVAELKLGGLTIPDIALAQKSVSLAKSIVEIENALAPNGNPVINWFLGKQDLSEFGKNLEAFGTSLVAYCNSVQGIDDGSIEASEKATSSLVGVMNSLKTSNGEFNAWAIKDFGSALKDFGGSYKTFVTDIKNACYGVNIDEITSNITTLYTSVGNIPLKTILNIDSLTKIDSSKIKTFGQDMKDFGADVKVYVDTVGEYLTSQIQKAVDNVKDLIEGLSEISKSDVENINSLTGSLTRLAEDGVQRFISEFTNKQTDAKTAGGNFIQNFIDGANEKKTSLDESAKLLSKAMLTQFTSLTVDYEDAGKDIVLDIANGANIARVAEENLKPMAQYAVGLQQKFETAIAEIDFYQVGYDILSTFCTAISESGAYVEAAFGVTETGLEDGVADIKVYYTSFYDAGYYLVDGFKLGIEERSKAVEESASNLGGKAFAALKNALKEASPSKLTYQVGEFFTQGFADGIVGDIDYVERSINYISDRTYEEMQNVINNIGDKLDDDIEDNLTITPVLDLTEFEAGTRIMNRYLGDMATSRVGAMAAADSMATRVTSQSIQNQMLEKLNESETPLGGESINHNNFYIQSNDPHEVATEVSRILQKQVERRNSVWE